MPAKTKSRKAKRASTKSKRTSTKSKSASIKSKSAIATPQKQGWTAYATDVAKGFEAFMSHLVLTEPSAEERKQLIVGARRSDGYIQATAAAWDKYADRTGLAKFDSNGVIDAIRQNGAMQPLVALLEQGPKRIATHLFNVRSRAGLDADRLVNAMRDEARLSKDNAYKETLKTLLDLRKQHRPKPTPRAKANKKSANATAPTSPKPPAAG